MTATTDARPSAMSSAAARLVELTQRREALVAQQARFQGLRDNSQQVLEEAQAQAQAQFGTSSVSEMREMYSKTMAENNQKLSDFDKKLTDTENAFGDISSRVGLGASNAAA